jgi:molybdopterin molybdotransferase
MRSVEQHLDAVLESISALEPFEIGLMESRGCVIAEDVVAPWPLPAFDAAAVDGFAVRVADVAGASA